jgi:hypothetical protein
LKTQVIIVGALDQAALIPHWRALQKTFLPTATQKSALIVDGSLSPELAALIPTNFALESVSAGCLCCLGGPVLKTVVARLLRQHRPDWLWILASPQAQLSALADAIDSPLLQAHVQLRAIAWLGNGQSPLPWHQQQLEAASYGPGVPKPANPAAQWETQVVFDRAQVKERLNAIAAPTGCYIDIKTARAWYRASAEQGVWQWRESDWRLYSRLVCEQRTSRQVILQIQAAINDCQTVSQN